MSERKPLMDEDKRKVLNLLEFCAEACPSQRVCQIINNAVPPKILARFDNDTFFVSDKELAGWLQDYADMLIKTNIKRWNNEGTT